MDIINSVGRRKSAIARVYVSEGKGNIIVNKRKFEDYFAIDGMKDIVRQPLILLNVREKYDIKANLTGGGFKGQAEALRLAISRALIKINEEDKPALKEQGLLTRDSRKVERKKPGQPKARKKFQFSKR